MAKAKNTTVEETKKDNAINVDKMENTAEEKTTGEGETKGLDVEALLKKQAADFQAQIDAMKAQNNRLNEELANLKTNTAEENELLGQKIAKIAGAENVPNYNPYLEDILYDVQNLDAGITTRMCGDEVRGIIGSIDKHLTKKLINGETRIEKHPYIITKVEK